MNEDGREPAPEGYEYSPYVQVTREFLDRILGRLKFLEDMLLGDSGEE